MRVSIATMLILALIAIGGLLLQVFLSKRESKWLGLILPCITFVYSLLMVAGLSAYRTGVGEIIVAIAVTFLLSNIPTIILLAIYSACREKSRRKKRLEQMSIQDLE